MFIRGFKKKRRPNRPSPITYCYKKGYSLIFSELMKKVPSGFTVRKKQDL